MLIRGFEGHSIAIVLIVIYLRLEVIDSEFESKSPLSTWCLSFDGIRTSPSFVRQGYSVSALKQIGS